MVDSLLLAGTFHRHVMVSSSADGSVRYCHLLDLHVTYTVANMTTCGIKMFSVNATANPYICAIT